MKRIIKGMLMTLVTISTLVAVVTFFWGIYYCVIDNSKMFSETMGVSLLTFVVTIVLITIIDFYKSHYEN